MNETVDNFCTELRTKLDGVEKRIKDLNASAKGATEKAKVEAKAQLAALENQSKKRRRQPAKKLPVEGATRHEQTCRPRRDHQAIRGGVNAARCSRGR
jgi:hypothetical protein